MFCHKREEERKTERQAHRDRQIYKEADRDRQSDTLREREEERERDILTNIVSRRPINPKQAGEFWLTVLFRSPWSRRLSREPHCPHSFLLERQARRRPFDMQYMFRGRRLWSIQSQATAQQKQTNKIATCFVAFTKLEQRKKAIHFSRMLRLPNMQ